MKAYRVVITLDQFGLSDKPSRVEVLKTLAKDLSDPCGPQNYLRDEKNVIIEIHEVTQSQ